MDAYKTPESDVELNPGRDFKPIKAIILGLLVSVVLSFVVSIIEGVIAGIILRVDLFSEHDLDAALSQNTTFLLTDVLITALLLFFAGRVVRKYTPRKEILFGFILSCLTFAVFLPIALSSNTFTTYPLWYNAASLLVIFVGVYLGARPGNKT